MPFTFLNIQFFDFESQFPKFCYFLLKWVRIHTNSATLSRSQTKKLEYRQIQHIISLVFYLRIFRPRCRFRYREWPKNSPSKAREMFNADGKHEEGAILAVCLATRKGCVSQSSSRGKFMQRELGFSESLRNPTISDKLNFPAGLGLRSPSDWMPLSTSF